MPLVIPGLNAMESKSDGKTTDQTSDWQSKLLGKKIGDSSDNMVLSPYHPTHVLLLPSPPLPYPILPLRLVDCWSITFTTDMIWFGFGGNRRLRRRSYLKKRELLRREIWFLRNLRLIGRFQTYSGELVMRRRLICGVCVWWCRLNVHLAHDGTVRHVDYQ